MHILGTEIINAFKHLGKSIQSNITPKLFLKIKRLSGMTQEMIPGKSEWANRQEECLDWGVLNQFGTKGALSRCITSVKSFKGLELSLKKHSRSKCISSKSKEHRFLEKTQNEFKSRFSSQGLFAAESCTDFLTPQREFFKTLTGKTIDVKKTLENKPTK